MRDEQLSLSPDGRRRPKVLVRDAADINRLRIHLVTHWKRPSVQFRVDELPALESQRAQDRFVRLSDGCNCLIGEMLGAMTLLGGSFMTWTSTRSWRDMGLVVIATLYAALMGKGIELAWTRLKLLRVLRRLRRRLAGEDFDEVAPVPTAFKPSRVEEEDVVQDNLIQRPVLPDGPKRPKVLLRDAADIDRLIPSLATRWTLPRIEIRVDALPRLDAQRAQTRIVRLSGGCSYLLAALLGVAILLGGLLYKVWTESQDWLYSQREDWWLLQLDWSDVMPVVIAALCAGFIGAAIEMVWLRVRLMLVLRGLRHQLG